MPLPPLFLARMETQLGDEYAAFLETYDQPPSVGLRVNTLKLTPEDFLALGPNFLTSTPSPSATRHSPSASSHPPRIPWSPAGFLLPPGSRPGKHPYHAAGLYYLQDPAAQAVAELMAPRPGERILDLAAAPGGKSTHIAALMQNRGLLVANDVHPRRVHTLARNLDRWGAHNAVVTNAMPDVLAARFGAYFDRVLVDAPCSGEGMFRKDPAARTEWQPKLVESCARRQDVILQDAARLVRPGGLLVYATCTFAPLEDEGTIARFLAAHPDFEIEPAPQFPGFDRGRPEWLTSTRTGSPGRTASPKGLEHAVRLWPHKAPGEGHFIALLRRGHSATPELPSLPSFAPSFPRSAAQVFSGFAAEALHWPPPRERLTLQGSYLYLVPEGLPDLSGLRVIRWGWWLGTVKKNRFEPSHALATGLRAADVRRTLSLTADDPALRRYLRGEVLPSDGAPGRVLVTVDGYPLGWGKRVRGRLKPRLPSWLRGMG